MAVASSQVTTRLPEFQEQYVADLLESAQNLFKPVAEGGKGLSMPFVQQPWSGTSTCRWRRHVSDSVSRIHGPVP
jgi:hypothetical protein